MHTIQSYLPIFSGFYNNPWFDSERGLEEEIRYINEKRKEVGKKDKIASNDIEFDYESYSTEASKKIVDMFVSCIKDRELDLFTKVEFENLWSPKYYNYSNDQINVCYTVSKNQLNNVLQYLLSNNEAFEEYLIENYTSMDGFISYHSNKTEDWVNLDSLDLRHKFGSILEFILRNEGMEEMHLELDEYLSVSEFIDNWDDLIRGGIEENYLEDVDIFSVKYRHFPFSGKWSNIPAIHMFSNYGNHVNQLSLF